MFNGLKHRFYGKCLVATTSAGDTIYIYWSPACRPGWQWQAVIKTDHKSGGYDVQAAGAFSNNRNFKILKEIAEKWEAV